MKYYMAPMEGITGYLYRNAICDYFGEGIDKYYTPFLVPHEKRAMSSKEIKEILPENNEGYKLIPQVLTNSATDFLRLEKALHEYGYDEVNINLGCPSRTVAGKGRGSGFLGRPEELNRFLEEVYSGCIGPVSVKTRIGERSTDEFDELMEIYNRYPIHELTVHPRIRFEYYDGVPHKDVFLRGFETSANPVCYNGNIYSLGDFEEIKSLTDNRLEAVMVGRGMLADPSLLRQLAGGPSFEMEELKDFLKRIRDDYSRVFSGETPVLQKMKELWNHMQLTFPDKSKECKQILKCKSLVEYRMLEAQILR